MKNELYKKVVLTFKELHIVVANNTAEASYFASEILSIVVDKFGEHTSYIFFLVLFTFKVVYLSNHKTVTVPILKNRYRLMHG